MLKLKNRVRLATLPLMLFATVTVFGQNAQIDEESQQVIDDCLEAMGSEMALTGVGGVKATGTINLDGDNEKFELKLVDDKLWLNFQDGEQLNICNGHYEWRMRDGEIQDDGRRSGIRHMFPYPGMALRWIDNCESVERAGETEFNGRQVEELLFKPKGLGDSFSRFFDKETDLLIAQKMNFGDNEMVLEFEYTGVDGIQIVSKVTIEQDSSRQELEMNNEIDAEIDESIFEVPESVKQGADSDDETEQRDEGDKKSADRKT